MDSKKTAKTTAIITAVLIYIITWKGISDWSEVGIHEGCGLVPRLIYPFFHANRIHAALNAWCLLSMVFLYDISLRRLCIAYTIAVLFPVDTLAYLGVEPCDVTVGLSGVVFALFGSISFEVKRKIYYQSCITAYLILGFVLPNTNGWIHLYCYLAGCMVALLNKPVKVG